MRKTHGTRDWACFALLILLAAAMSAEVRANDGAVQEATTLSARAEQLYKQGRYREALPAARRALAIRETALGPNNPDVATSLSMLGDVLVGAGDYRHAQAPYERALAIREKVLGAENRDTAHVLNRLGDLFDIVGDYSKAEQLLQRALAIREREVGTDDPDFAESLHSLGELYEDTGDLGKAESLLTRALSIREKALGPEHPDTARTLASLGWLYDSTNSYAKARPLLERALAICEKVLGPEHPDTATSLGYLGWLDENLGDYSSAEPLFVREVAIREKALGLDHSDTAIALKSLGRLYRETGRYAKAEPLYQRALAINETVFGLEHPNTISALEGLAMLYRDTGDYEKAQPLLEQALAIAEKIRPPGHPDIASALDCLAWLYESKGEYSQAEPLYVRALAIREKALGPADPETAMSLNNLGGLYDEIGAYAKAESLYQRALDAGEKSLGPDHPGVAPFLNNLAEIYRETGEYARAEPLYLRALAIKEKKLGADNPSTALALNNLGELYEDTGANAKAEPLLLRALAIREKVLGPTHPMTASSLANLAGLYDANGDFDKALPLYERALAIREKVLGPMHPETASSLNNLAWVLEATGDSSKAQSLYARALSIEEKSLGPDHPLVATTLNNLADISGDNDTTRSLLERALSISEKSLGPDHPDTALYLFNLAVVDSNLGDYTQADTLYERAQSVLERNTERFLLSGSEERKTAYVQSRARSVQRSVSVSLKRPSARTTALALTNVLQYKGRVLDAMSDEISQLRLSAAPEDRALLDQLSAVAKESSALTFRGLGSLSPAAYQERLNSLASQQDQLESQLSTRSAAFRHVLIPITLGNVRQHLPDDAILVEWFRYSPWDPQQKAGTNGGDARYVAYLLKHSGDPEVVDLGPAQPIEDLVAELRTAVSDPNNSYFSDVAQDLSEKLIRPLHLEDTQSGHLFLSPDGALNLVPFAALLDERGEYLLQHFDITYLTSGRDLFRMSAHSPVRSSPVILANPDFGKTARAASAPLPPTRATRSATFDRSALSFTPLPGTAVEAEVLRSLLKLDAGNVFTGGDASKATLRDLHGPMILHLATHGFFLDDQEIAAMSLKGLSSESKSMPVQNSMLRSGLALAGANARQLGDSDDGILTAAETAKLDLLGTQLVVLSACETGLGMIRTGEGVYGLRRALVLAGSQAQLTSLWKVSDAGTQELMADYYRRLLKGQGRSQALRLAQQTMLTKPERRHPYYWAAFIPVGNWAPLTTK